MKTAKKAAAATKKSEPTKAAPTVMAEKLAKALTTPSVSEQLAKIASKKGASVTATAATKAALKNEPVAMDPKKIASAIVNGKTDGKVKAGAKAPVAPPVAPVTSRKVSKDAPNAIGLLALQMIQKGAKAAGNPASAHAVGGEPQWLWVGAGEDKTRVLFRKLKQYLREASRTEDEVSYTLAAAALPLLKPATKVAATK